MSEKMNENVYWVALVGRNYRSFSGPYDAEEAWQFAGQFDERPDLRAVVIGVP